MSTPLQVLQETLLLLKQRFNRLFFCPGHLDCVFLGAVDPTILAPSRWPRQSRRMDARLEKWEFLSTLVTDCEDNQQIPGMNTDACNWIYCTSFFALTLIHIVLMSHDFYGYHDIISKVDLLHYITYIACVIFIDVLCVQLRCQSVCVCMYLCTYISFRV